MATEDYWAGPVIERNSLWFRYWYLTLDDAISQDDPVRLFDEILTHFDWSSWEVVFRRMRGQPPIAPKTLAGIILYGMYLGIRSSRKLEEACKYRLDFKWLAEGRIPDHTTISKFRTRFHDQLKDLFKQIGAMALELGLIRLGVIAFDATRIRANNSRFATRTAKTLEAKLEVLDELYETLVKEMDTRDANGTGEGNSSSLPEELRDVDKRREHVKQLLGKVQSADETRRQNGINPEKNPAQVPTTDPDSRVMPNKEGGYAPNYTPVATTDGTGGFIVDCDVLNEVNESSAAIPSIDRIHETFGVYPEIMLTDAGNNSGQVLLQMEERGVECYAPVQSYQPEEGSPVLREDLSQPIPESEWPNLKRNSKGQLDKSCFVYVPETDQYYCPQGQPLTFLKTSPERRGTERVTKRVYRSSSCAGCPLAEMCLSPQNKHGRTITRDSYEEVRERTAARMATEEGRQLYDQRPRIAEGTFGILKRVMGFRQFLLRGLAKVKIEWLWAATAFNSMKLVRAVAKLRAEVPETPALTQN